MHYARNLSLIILLIFLGCTSVKPAGYTGFLKDYSRLKPSDEVEGLLVEKYPDRKISDYKKFLVDPIEIDLHDEAKGLKQDDTQVFELAMILQLQAIKKISEKHEVVDVPGKGVLRIRTAITDVMANKPYLNLHWTTTATGAGLGGAAIEAEFVDSLTGERIMAVVDTRKGKAFQKNIIESYTKGWSKWGHTKDVFDQWIAMLMLKLEDKTIGEDNR